LPPQAIRLRRLFPFQVKFNLSMMGRCDIIEPTNHIIFIEVIGLDRVVLASLPVERTREAFEERLCRRYPFLSRIEVGKSVLGRSISGLKLGGGEDAVLYAGAFHAQEWLTALVLLRFAERLCQALDSGGYLAGIDCRKAFLGRGLVIVPCVNPDGVEIALTGAQAACDLTDEVLRISGGDLSAWNANARGVDINHNFDAGWHIVRQLEQSRGIDGPSPRRYGGSSPASEPETQALVALCERMNFRSAIAFHSQGEEIYWKYGERTPPGAALMARVLAMASGYELKTPSAIASHGGFKDWFIEKLGRPGFTVEMGKGKNPLPLTDLEPVYDRLEELLMLGVVM